MAKTFKGQPGVIAPLNPYHPWDWYIYPHLVVFNGTNMVNVGKYTIVPWMVWDMEL